MGKNSLQDQKPREDSEAFSFSPLLNQELEQFAGQSEESRKEMILF